MYLISEKEMVKQQADNDCYPCISSDKTLGKPRKYSPSATSRLDNQAASEIRFETLYFKKENLRSILNTP